MIIFQAQSTGTGFDFSGSGSGKSILSQYEYNRKAKMPRVGVQQTEDIEEFEDDDWLDMDFYEDNIKTGMDTWNNNCPFTLSVNSNIKTFCDYQAIPLHGIVLQSTSLAVMSIVKSLVISGSKNLKAMMMTIGI